MKGMTMKYSVTLLLLIAMLLVTGDAAAQRRRMSPNEPRPERLEKFKKMRLIEELNLNEDDAIKFFAKQNAHEDKLHEMIVSRNEVIDRIETMLKESPDSKDLQKNIDQILDIDQKIFSERRRFQDEMRQFLPPAKFARFLSFERNFGRQVRDAVGDMYRERRRRLGDD